MTKSDLINWLNNNPGHQQKLEIEAGLSAGYLSKLKTKDITPSKGTLKLLEMVIKTLKKRENN